MHKQMEHEQIQGTPYSFKTTVKVVQLKNEVIVLCFLTLETRVEHGSESECSMQPMQIKTELQTKKNMQHLPAQNSSPPQFIPP